MNNLIKTMLCSAAALVLAGTSVAQTRRAFTELDFSTIQSPNSNPFGLAYRDAITANEQGKVNIHRACDILAQYPGVDASRVGVLGICGGGGYTLKATGRALRTCVKPILICSPSFPVILSAGLPFPPAVSQTQDGFLQKTGRKPTACKGKFVSLQAVCRHTPQASGAQTPHIKHI